MSYERPLDRLETISLNMPGTFYLEYRGTLDEDAMRRAVALTGLRFPILRAHVTKKENSFFFSAPEEASVPVFEAEADSSLFQRVAEEWDIARGVAQVTLAKTDTGGYMGLTTDHSAADGRAIFALLEQIWKNYTNTVTSRTDPVANRADLPSAPTKIIEKYDLANSDSTLNMRASGTLVDKVVLHQEHYTMGHRETSNLKGIANSHQTTIHALVCGAILTAQRKHLETMESAPQMTCMSAVDLRRYLTPAIHPCDVTNFSTTHDTTVRVPTDGSPIDVGIEVRRKLTNGISNREPLNNFVRRLYPQNDGLDDPTIRLTEAGEGRLDIATVSNLGALPDIPCPSGITIVNLHDRAHNGLQPHPAYIVYAQEGQIRVRFIYQPGLFPDEHLENLWSSVKSQLQELAIR